MTGEERLELRAKIRIWLAYTEAGIQLPKPNAADHALLNKIEDPTGPPVAPPTP